jgi:hypothetical protein
MWKLFAGLKKKLSFLYQSANVYCTPIIFVTNSIKQRDIYDLLSQLQRQVCHQE